MKRDFKEFKQYIKNKNTAVVGIGVSNTPLIYFLLSLGAKVTAFDKKNEEVLGEEGKKLKEAGVNLVLGENYLEKLKGFEVIFKTPSMRSDSLELINCAKEGAYITSEMEEFMKYCPAKIYGITGSDGKTTTTSLVYRMLCEAGYVTYVGGNIGKPLFSEIQKINKNDKVVLELSSFQLMTITVSPEVGIITNLSPNHLDIHKDMKEYINAKKTIYKYQSKDDVIILNCDNEITNSFKNEVKGNLLQFSTKEVIEKGAYYKDETLYAFGENVCNKSEVKLMGMHNIEDLLAAFCAVHEDVDIASMRKVATTFTGVEHRCEFIRELDGVKYYNDSIGTSPTRTLAGLKAFPKPVILIAGGYDKKLPFNTLAEEGYSKIKHLILVGATKYKIKDEFDKLKNEKGIEVPVEVCDKFEDTVIRARKAASQGDIVILSPACASFDFFPNFEARGNRFKEIVNNL